MQSKSTPYAVNAAPAKRELAKAPDAWQIVAITSKKELLLPPDTPPYYALTFGWLPGNLLAKRTES